MKEFITHPVLGKITVSQSGLNKRISLSVRPTGEIRLSFPVRTTLQTAIEFLDSKQGWILKALDKYRRQRNREIISMPYSTRMHHLELAPCDCEEISVKVARGVIKVDYPLTKHFCDDDVQVAIKLGIEEAWRREAKKLLPGRVAALASEHGFGFGKVTIRNTVSRWGSCSTRDDISLSIHLMRLPDHLIDYVIIHELCHTVQRDHSYRFYELLDQQVGGRHKALNKELKPYHTRWR